MTNEHPTDETLNSYFAILSAERRRRAIRAVDAADQPLTKGRLADILATAEYGAGYTSSQRKSVYVALHQSHLPKLVAEDVFEEVQADTYDIGPAGDALVAMLDRAVPGRQGRAGQVLRNVADSLTPDSGVAFLF